MCVICVKKKGAAMPSHEEITKMAAANPHGAGYMFARGNVLHIRKGYMTVTDLEAALKADGVTAADPLILHFRLSSCVGVRPELCHPYPVSKNPRMMKRLSVDMWGQNAIGLAHNGVMSKYNPVRGNLTDTANFILLNTDAVKAIIQDPDDDMLAEWLQAEIDANKLALMSAKGNIVIYGDFTERNGRYYSNMWWNVTRTRDARYGAWWREKRYDF